MEIKNRFTGEVIYKSKGKILRTVVEEAIEQRANLSEANLRGANLSEANLWGADLLPDLYILKFQPPKTILRGWKYLRDGKSPYQSAEYEVGKVYTEKDFSTDERITCNRGLNVATLQWCLNDSPSDVEFIEVEFYAKDIVAIPFATDGKFRVKRFKVLRKIIRDEAEKIVAKFLEPYCKGGEVKNENQ